MLQQFSTIRLPKQYRWGVGEAMPLVLAHFNHCVHNISFSILANLLKKDGVSIHQASNSAIAQGRTERLQQSELKQLKI